jgi:hypothetical protein
MRWLHKWEHQTIVADTRKELEEKVKALRSAGWEIDSTKYVPPDPRFGGILGGHYEASLRRRKP